MPLPLLLVALLLFLLIDVPASAANSVKRSSDEFPLAHCADSKTQRAKKPPTASSIEKPLVQNSC